MGGESVQTICSAIKINKDTLFNWLANNDSFSDQYARARELSGDTLEGEALDAVRAAVDRDSAAAAQVKLAGLRWVASKRNAKKYGDKLDLNHSGTVNLAGLLGMLDDGK
jgi:hypothetical protein